MIWLCDSCLDQLRTVARETIWEQLQPSQLDVIRKYDGDHEDIFESLVEDMLDSLYSDLDSYAEQYFCTEYTGWMDKIIPRLDEWEEECKEEEEEDNDE